MMAILSEIPPEGFVETKNTESAPATKMADEESKLSPASSDLIRGTEPLRAADTQSHPAVEAETKDRSIGFEGKTPNKAKTPFKPITTSQYKAPRPIGSSASKFVTPAKIGAKSGRGGFAAPRSTGPSKPLHATATKTPLTLVKAAPTKEELQEEIEALKKEHEELAAQTQELRKLYDESALQGYMKALHEYNEIKDIAQMLLGRLAESRGTTTRAMYEEFGLDLDD